MKGLKGVLLALGLLALAWVTLAPAQEQQPSQHKAATATLTGCLSGPNSGGRFLLQTGSGSVEVAGDLQKHVGHEVKVTGTVVEDKPAEGGQNKGQDGSASSQGGGQYLQVTQVQMIADSCKTK